MSPLEGNQFLQPRVLEQLANSTTPMGFSLKFKYFTPKLAEKLTAWGGEKYLKAVSERDFGSINLNMKTISYPPFESPDLFEIFEYLISVAPNKSYAQWHAFGCSVYYSYHDSGGKVKTISNSKEDEEAVNLIKTTYTKYEVIRQ